MAWFKNNKPKDNDPDPGAYDQESRHDERAAGHNRDEAYCTTCNEWYSVSKGGHNH